MKSNMKSLFPFPLISSALLPLTLATASAATAGLPPLPALDHTLGPARVTTTADTLTVTTGAITQRWTLVPTGLATTSLVNLATGKDWCVPSGSATASGSAKIPLGGRRETPPNSPPSPNPKPPSGNLALPDSAPAAPTSNNTTCDWAFHGLLDNRPAKLLSLTATTDNDEGFAAPHIRILAEFEYPDAATTVRYEIWAYPGANGLRTLLWFKGDSAKHHTKPKPLKTDIVSIRANTGPFKELRRINDAAFHYKTPQPDWFNTVAARNAQPLTIALDNLDPKKTYRIGLSFFNNVTSETIQQTVALLGDKQTIATIANVELKPRAAPQTLYIDIPAGKLPATTATLRIASKKQTALSMASEVIVYEKNPDANPGQPSIREIPATVPARLPQLIAAAPAGYRLVGYDNLGSKLAAAPATPNGYLARLPVNTAGTTRLYGGYFNDTQNRNLRETPLLREETYTDPIAPTHTERVNWASFVALQNPDANETLILLKESYKTANQSGHDTGDFILDRRSLTNTGLGLAINEITPAKYTRTWANWTILHTGADTDATALAIKKFDRTRFPLLGPLTLMSNTWGTGKTNERYSAREENVLTEIASGADLGVEAVQIDDGWQGNTYGSWRPSPKGTLAGIGDFAVYPEGWKNVRAAAAKAGLALGLWTAMHECPLPDMQWNADQGDFRYFKWDFGSMPDRAGIDAMENKARALILHSNHKVKIDWDLTEISQRVGIYTARQYGDLFLENRKPRAPISTTYIPYLVLRDAWHISKYVNLNKIQINIQNVAHVNPKLSNAHLHDQGYVTAIALMSSPLYFCETQYFDAPARAQMRPLIAAWKNEKAALARGYVHPIGSEPDDASWTGFQNTPENSATGYLMLFRELNNKENSSALALKNVANKTLRLTDLLTGETRDAPADAQGRVTFTMDKPGDYRFYKYTIL